ncbi:TonB-dependent receptor [Echinicola sediminis]
MIKQFTLSLVLILLYGSITAQQLQIHGQVLDESSSGMPGVSILEKGSTNGTVTDLDGKFSLAVNKEASLIFSFIGYQTKEVKVVNQNELTISMDPNAMGLEEVVVIGYGTSQKKDLTGSITSLKLEDSPIQNVANVNALSALKGSLPGLSIGNPTGAGQQPNILIRGQNSLLASNSPLLVVDGVIYNGSLSEINPGDIASIDVLKDAGSAAVYGANSANGVIVVTTKKGNTGKPKFNFSTYTGTQFWTNKPDVLKGEDYLTFRKDVLRANGASEADLNNLDYVLYPKEAEAYRSGKSIDWYDEIAQSGIMSNYQMSVSGGSEKMDYYISGSYLDQDGVVLGDKYNRANFLAKVNSEVNEWLSFGFDVRTGFEDRSGNAADFYMASAAGPFGYKNVTISGFEHQIERFPQSQTSVGSPLWSLQNHNLDKTNSYRGTGRISVKAPWVEGLSYDFRLNLGRSETFRENFVREFYYVNTLKEEELRNPQRYLNQANGNSSISKTDNWLINHLINYNRNFNNLHRLDVTLLAERQKRTSKGLSFSATDFSEAGTTVLGVNALELGVNSKRGGGTGLSELQQLAYMGRINYVYNDRYSASFTARRDGYSAFSANNKYGNFFSGGLAWTISEENFFKNTIGAVDYLKLRTTYGENGNPSIGAYSTLASIGVNSMIFGQQTMQTIYQSSLSNQTLSWETTTSFNFGLDFELFTSRLNGSVDYYISNTTDLLLNRRLPVTTGFSSVNTNLGKVHNKGLEIALNTVNVQSKDFRWNSAVTFFLNRNEIKSLYGIDSDGDGKEDDDRGNGWFIGKSLGAIYDYTFDGIVQESDTEYLEQYGGAPGDAKFKDISGPEGVPDGKITPDDRSIIGYSKPNFNLNLANTFSYKNFELYFSFFYTAGGGKNNWYMANNLRAYVPILPTNFNWVDRPYWTPERPSTEVPRPTYGNPYGYQFWQDHSFLRLQDVSLSYSLDQKTLEKLGPITRAKFYISGKNLLTLSDWIGLDPENATTYYSYGLPGMGSINIGANISF